MSQQLLEMFRMSRRAPATSPRLRYSSVYQPEPPLGFIKRSDPNFYFLSRRSLWP